MALSSADKGPAWPHDDAGAAAASAASARTTLSTDLSHSTTLSPALSPAPSPAPSPLSVDPPTAANPATPKSLPSAAPSGGPLPAPVLPPVLHAEAGPPTAGQPAATTAPGGLPVTAPSSIEPPSPSAAVASPAPDSRSTQNGDHSHSILAGEHVTGPSAGCDMSNFSPVTLTAVAAAAPPSVSPSGPSFVPIASLPSTSTLHQPPDPAAAAFQSPEAYPLNAVGANAPVPPLPSMRPISSMPQSVTQPQPLHHAASTVTTAPPTPISNPLNFYSHSSIPLPTSNGFSHETIVRYPLPHDPRILGSRGPKKEIKRRTKTGCMTCRKRRIKCDEAHPTCNNCRKSKRECSGYDPIFKPQLSHIQPVPTSVLPSTSLRSTPVLAPRPDNSYGSQPSMLPSAYAADSTTTLSPTSSEFASTAVNYCPSPSTAVITPVKDETACDPSSGTEQPSTSLQDGSSLLDRNQSFSDDGRHPPPGKRMKINDIIDLLGPPPPPQQVSHAEDTFNEITRVYHEMYAMALGAFFETTWYFFMDNGKMIFPKDAALIEHMASFLKILEAVKANDHTQMTYSGVLETRIVWELACTAYSTPDQTNGARSTLPADGDAAEARNRLRVLETLLCGEYLDENPLAPPAADHDQHRIRQFDFWYSLAEFVRKRDNPGSPQAAQAREAVLSRMRHLLDGRENRDLLYSIAVVRELAPNFDAGYGETIPQHLDETDPKSRLAVASKFILDEAQVTGGTTNVVRRFSDIASRAFVNPGVNVARKL
ncbi:hypothetical protein RJ55_05683 [Drechmeria coniospora]|nr:hypothetical protein RJ55_05683 [Drechmeria coniospora]